MVNIKKREIGRYILAGISVAGILFVGAVAPNIFQMIPRSFLKRYPKKSVERSVERAVENLKRRGLIKLTQGPNGWRLEITGRGREIMDALELKEKILKHPKRWDKKWRLLIFDIAEKRKHIRDKIRRALISLGFYRLQDSVWIYPYECEEILELLRIKYGVRYEALYLRVEYLAKDKYLKQHFGLA